MLHGQGGDDRSTPEQRDLPWSIALLRWIAVFYLFLFKRFRIVDGAHIPDTGALILVANHTTAYDPVCLQVACRRRLVRFMQAREFYEIRPFFYLYKLLQVIPVNRTGNDTVSVRTALRTLSGHGCLGIFPEGKISEDGELHEARKGVALLALLSNATVIPAFLQGTLPTRGMVRDFFQFNRVTLYFGRAIRFDDLTGKRRDQQTVDLALTRTMGALRALRDRHGTVSSVTPQK